MQNFTNILSILEKFFFLHVDEQIDITKPIVAIFRNFCKSAKRGEKISAYRPPPQKNLINAS